MNIQTRFGRLPVFFLVAMATTSVNAKSVDEPWLGRPWEYSYIVQVDSTRGMNSERRVAQKGLAKADPREVQWAAAIFDWIDIPIPTSEKWPDSFRSSVAILTIRFDNEGIVLTPYHWTAGLKAHISRIYDIELAVGDSSDGLKFDLGHWYTGYSSEEAIYVPAICSSLDMDGRYKKSFDRNDPIDGNFGCREWGYYLQSPDHPYIDVTSYQKQGASIRAFVGWGRFDTPPKPVIGKMVNTWLCLHDCPDGEAPGVIPDIKAWTSKRGWPVPKQPKRQPMFMDRPHKPGEFVD